MGGAASRCRPHPYERTGVVTERREKCTFSITENHLSRRSVGSTTMQACLFPARIESSSRQSRKARLLHSIWRFAATFQRGLPTLVGPEQGLVMEQEVDTLLRKAIEVVPPHVRESEFYSRYCIVLKKEGEVAFRSEEHIHPSTQEVPEVRFGGKAALGVRHRDVVLAHMKGLRLNAKKSVLSPLQRTTYLGVVWDLTTMQARLSPARIESILTAVVSVRKGRSLAGPVLGAPCCRVMLATDASLTGWGAVMDGHPAHAQRWSTTSTTREVCVAPLVQAGAPDPCVVPGQTPLAESSSYSWASQLGSRHPAEARGMDASPRGGEADLESILPGSGVLERVRYVFPSPEYWKLWVWPLRGTHLIASGLSTEVVETTLQSRAPSSRKLYALKWKPFTSWCGDRQQDSVNCPIGTVLGFLQDRFSTGLAHSTLKVYVVVISAYHAPLGGSSVGRNPLVTRFLHGVLFHTRQGFEVWWRGHLVPIAFLMQLEFLRGNVSGYVCNHGSQRERDAASRAILPASLQRLLLYPEAAGCMHRTCF
ncbi:hypothetical protein M9458_050534 [Cirrhinus mrigala]|uniref:Uncharacterized protein n=1 Tax=Cirrhinus mrigala TaxID=683832 RepID=A0ABD0MX10_CIRMR